MARLNTIIPGRITDANDNPISNGYVYFYAAGTTTPKNTYSDRTLTTANTNPLRTNAGGQPTSGGVVVDIWTEEGSYKVDVRDSLGASIDGYPRDNVTGGGFVTDFAVNILNYGPERDGTTNDLAAFVAAAADTPTNGRVVVAPGRYMVTGSVSRPDIDWDMAKGAVILGINDIFADMSYGPMTARLWTSTPVQVTMATDYPRYFHQPNCYVNLEGKLVWAAPTNPYTVAESANSRQSCIVVTAETIEQIISNGSGTFGDPIYIMTDPNYITNPWDVYDAVTGTPTSAQTCGINLNRHGLGSKEWITIESRQAQAADPTKAGHYLLQKTASGGKFTMYSFWQNISTREISLFLGEDRPSASYQGFFDHEGLTGLVPYLHAVNVDSDNNVNFWTILRKEADGGLERRLCCNLRCTNAASTSDPTLLTWELGPSIPLGDAQSTENIWEWDADEQSKGYFVGLVRQNYINTAAYVRQGRVQLAIDGDGMNFGSMEAANILSHLGRPSVTRFNPGWMGAALWMRYGTRSMLALWGRRPNGWWFPGPKVDNITPYSTKPLEVTKTSASQTIFSGSGLEFTGNYIEARLPDNSIVDFYGRVSDTAAGTIDIGMFIGSPDSFDVGDTFVLGNTALETFVITSGNDTILSPAGTWTEANTLGWADNDPTGLAAVVPEKGIWVSTASENVTLSTDAADQIAVGEALELRQNSGALSQIADIYRDPSGLLFFGHSENVFNRSPGTPGENPRCSIVQSTDLPQWDYINVTLRDTNRYELGDDGHSVTYDSGTGLITCYGAGHAAIEMPPVDGQIAVPWKVVTALADGEICVVAEIGGPEETLLVLLSNAEGTYYRQIWRLRRGGGSARDSFDQLLNVRATETYGYWHTLVVQYEVEKKLILIDGEQFRLEPPYLIYTGDGHLIYGASSTSYIGAPTTQRRDYDLSGIKWIPLPAGSTRIAEEEQPNNEPNEFPDPAIWIRSSEATTYTAADYTYITPYIRWGRVYGAVASATLTSNSVNAQMLFGGVPNNLRIDITTLGTQPLEIDFVIPELRRRVYGTRILEHDILYVPATGSTLLPGPEVEIQSVQYLGGGLELTGLHMSFRALRHEKRIEEAITFREFKETGDRLLIPEDSWYAIRYAMIAEENGCSFVFRRPDLSLRRGRRQFELPDPIEVERNARRFYYRFGGGPLLDRAGNPSKRLPARVLASTTQAEVLLPKPVEMERLAEITVEGQWGFVDDGNSLYSAAELVIVGQDDDFVNLRLSGLDTLTAAQDGWLAPTGQAAEVLDGDGTIYSKGLGFEAFDPSEIVVTQGTITLDPTDDFHLKPTNGTEFDRLVGAASGVSTIYSDWAIATDVSTQTLVKVNATSGVETLTNGSGNDWVTSEGTAHLHNITLSAAAGSGDEYFFVNGRRSNPARVILNSIPASTLDTTITSNIITNAAVHLRAQFDRPPNDYDAATVALLAEMTDYTLFDAARYDRFVRSLKTSGIWALLDILYVLGAHNAAAAVLNWKNPSAGTFDLTLVNAPTFTAYTGYTTNGTTNYLNSSFQPATDTVVTVGQNDMAVFTFLTDDSTVATANYMIGGATNAISPRATNGSSPERFAGRLNDGTTNLVNSFMQGSGAGLTLTNRSGAAGYDLWQTVGNTLKSKTVTQTSTGLSNDEFRIGENGGAFGAGTTFCAGLAKAMTASQIHALHEAINVMRREIGSDPRTAL